MGADGFCKQIWRIIELEISNPSRWSMMGYVFTFNREQIPHTWEFEIANSQPFEVPDCKLDFIFCSFFFQIFWGH